ncbi:FecR domain-containing protein [Halomonas llamarensis]|uniref:FecR domain-containing protein n=1 Tax=Halomonas llamarensis TaxID=2945104 RepID=A0ABT0SU71_9GAMM|nr:FecR domain-containing protein [Halomonas llamarensis]MCL7931389.1 FecR domain-containing protein [Halomonas llamarensis]
MAVSDSSSEHPGANLASPDTATLEAAAEWYAELREAAPDSPRHGVHRDWLDQHPSHRQAWARVEKLNQQFQTAPSGMLQPILKRARSTRRRSVELLLILLMVGVGILGGGWQAGLHHPLMADHATATGERRQLRLADGSLVHLNTGTALDVHFDDKQRRIHLRQGEIQVATAASDDKRPFFVTTAEGRVRALGTRFLVRRQGDQSRVTVLEHAVDIHPAQAQGAVTRLDAGYQAQFSDNQTTPPQPVTGRPAAWVQGQLIVSDWSLARFVEELSRHHKGVLSHDADVADLRISGAFHLHSTDALLDNLAGTLPVRIRRFTPYWVRVEPLE